MKYFSMKWYVYLFDFSNMRYSSFTEKLRVFICRIKGHPNGVVWFTNATALEPDMSCRDCGEALPTAQLVIEQLFNKYIWRANGTYISASDLDYVHWPNPVKEALEARDEYWLAKLGQTTDKVSKDV